MPRKPSEYAAKLVYINVGYAQQDLQNGFTMAGATFTAVTGDNIQIQDIKVTGENAEEGDVNIQTLDRLGRTVNMYTYYGEDVFDDGYAAGWYDDDGLVDVDFASGQGLWIAAPDADTSVTFAGKVPTSDVVITLQNGFTATANMMPVSVSIQDIIVTGDNAEEGDVNIQTLDRLGRTINMYTYYGEDVFDDGCPAGWYDDDGLVDVTFNAGAGLWVAAPDNDTTIRFPAPEL